MIELELFFKTVESEVRRKHIKYLKKQKCLPDSSAAGSAAADEKNGKEHEEFKTLFGGDKVKLVKQFNKGVDMALKVLEEEYARFDSRLKAESERGKKF